MNQADTGTFVKVDGKPTEDIPAVGFVGLAYGFIWVAVLGYVLYVARGLGRVKADLAELRRKLNAGDAGRRGPE